MKKGLVAILAVAIIGSLGIYGKSHSNSAQASSDSTTPTVSAASSDNSAPSSDSTTPASTTSGFKDGTYTGQTENTAYGPVQISVIISSGRIIDIDFLQMPNDLGHTQEVTAQSKPILKQETLTNQNGQVDFVSGATDTSFGYQKSLQAALDQARVS